MCTRELAEQNHLMGATRKNGIIQQRLRPMKQPKKRYSGNVSSNKLLNYQLREVELKSQLTSTDTMAYAPWKWAVDEKLRVNLIIYLI